MEPDHASIINIKKYLSGFNAKSIDINNKDYLEGQIRVLEDAILNYRIQSKNSELPPRIRARSRDLEQNASGLLNGIKFSLSLLQHDKEKLSDR